jgi:hypothetical protein
MPSEPKEHTFLDSGLTSRILYLQASNWFPNTQGALPEQTTRSSKWLKETEMDVELHINPAEQVRLNKLMEKDVTVGIEKLSKLEKPATVSQKLKKMREERSKTRGGKWYHLGRPEMTDELKQELTVLRLLKYTTPGKYKKGGARGGEDEYFEIGSVVAPASAYFTDRATSSADGRVRKSAKLGFVDSLLQDTEYKRYAKRKRQEVLEKAEKNAKRSKPPGSRK